MREDIHISKEREQGWYSGENVCLPPMAICGFVGSLFTLLSKVILQVLRFSLLLKHQKFDLT